MVAHNRKQRRDGPSTQPNTTTHPQTPTQAALASNDQEAQQPDNNEPESLPSERKLFRAAEEASVRDMVVDKNEARAAALIDSYRSQSRTDPRRLLGVVTEGVYYSPSMNPQDWGYQLRG